MGPVAAAKAKWHPVRIMAEFGLTAAELQSILCAYAGCQAPQGAVGDAKVWLAHFAALGHLGLPRAG